MENTRTDTEVKSLNEFESIVRKISLMFQHLFEGPIVDYFREMGKVIYVMFETETDNLPPMGYLKTWIGKEEAEFLLSHLSKDQRLEPNFNQIRDHALDQIEDWDDNTGDAIRINTQGLNADGQLRLNGILKNCKVNPDFGLMMTLIFNVTRVPDKARPRRLADFVKQVIDERFGEERLFKGVKHGEREFNTLVSNAAIFYHNWIHGKPINSRGIKIKEKRIISLLEKNPEIIDVCMNLFSKKFNDRNFFLRNYKKMDLKFLAIIELVGRKSNPEKTSEFMSALLNNETDRKDVIGTLFDSLFKWKNEVYKKTSTDARFASTLKAYNAFVEGRNLKSLLWDKREKFPKINFTYEDGKPVI